MSGPVRILVAEDNSNDAFLLERAFSKTGVPVPIHFVRDGQEAVDYLQQHQPAGEPTRERLPSLLLLDLRMPRLNGFDVVTWLRQQPALHRLPVVVFTSSKEPEDIDRAYALGVNSYLVKPQTLEGLIDLVQSLRQYWLELNTLPDAELGGANGADGRLSTPPPQTGL